MFAPIEGGRIGLAGWCFIGLLVFITWVAFRSRRRIATMPKLPSRTRHFVSTMVMLVLLFTLALMVSRVDGIALFPGVAPPPLRIAAGLVIALALTAAMKPTWRRAVTRGDRRIHLFSPGSAREKALWTGVSLCAAIAEETAYRGVLYVLFLTLTRSPSAAAVLSALIFAANHAMQSLRSMVIIFFIALILQALALWAGALYVGMLAHFVYDVVAGFTCSRLVREMGDRAEGEPHPAIAAPEPAGV